jgi:hypothetical protein
MPTEIAQANAITGIIDLAHFICFIILAPFFCYLPYGKQKPPGNLAVRELINHTNE